MMTFNLKSRPQPEKCFLILKDIIKPYKPIFACLTLRIESG